MLEQKYFGTKILIMKIYNTISQCDTVFALLRPSTGTERNTGSNESLHMRTQYRFKIGSFALALHARNVAIPWKSQEKSLIFFAFSWSS